MKRNFKTYKPTIFIILFCVSILLFNESGLIKWYSLKNEQIQLMKSINELDDHQAVLEKHIDQLTYDFDYIEFIAYSRFKMVKPGEKIFRVKDYKQVNQ